jgi:DNA-binding IclR family transcriptional regulator
MHAMLRFDRRIAAHHPLYRNRFHHQAPAWHEEGEALAVGRLEAGHDGVPVPIRHHHRRIAALISHMHAALHPRGRVAEALTLNLRQGCLSQCIQHFGHGL